MTSKVQFFFISLLAFLLTNKLLVAQNTDSLLRLAREAKTTKNLPLALRNYLQVMKILEKRQEKNPALAKVSLAPLYVEIGQIYEQGKLHENALSYFKKSNALDENANTNELIGNELLNSENNTEALAAYSKALEQYKKENNYLAIIRNLGQIVTCYKKLNNYSKALESSTEMLVLAQKNNDKQQEMTTLNNIGYIYRYLQNYGKALDFLNKTLDLKKSLQVLPQEQAITLVNIGVVSQNMGNYSGAIENLLEALQLMEKQKNMPEICKIQDLMAVVYLNSKDFYNAEVYNDLSVDLAEKLKNPFLLQDVYKTKSDILQAKEDFQNALNFYKKHLNLRDSLELAENIEQQKLLQQQFAVERDEKNTLDALSNEEARKAAMQQLQTEVEKQKLAVEKQMESRRADAEKAKASEEKQKSEKEIAEKELKILKQQREAEQREKQFLALEKERAVQELELEKQKAKEKETQRQVAKLKQDKEIQDLKVEQQSLQAAKQAEETKLLYAVLGFILLFTIVSIFILLNIRKKNSQLAKQKEEIEVKNIELEQTQEELKAQRDTLEIKSQELDLAYTNIKASITYAKRIQTAILPPISQIRAYLPECFVLFKPRDIVSGDFYWFAPLSEYSFVIAAVDCTGHGVPGAFMSMIGDSLLNQIIVEKNIISPDIVLAELHKGIKNSLQKGSQNAKDGMDIAICVIDKATKILEFAAAMNPICVIQNGDLQEIKADKRAIGSDETNDFAFTKHTIDISIPTSIYMYSDGFQDQFGGTENRKFMVRRFRNLLFEIHKNPMSEQEQILHNTIHTWMGNTHKQIDDILVIGLQI
jgi:serine phosphatase RsbU (regulator of sigma subunit)/tetratricopeptide (TPR) repeat protein